MDPNSDDEEFQRVIYKICHLEAELRKNNELYCEVQKESKQEVITLKDQVANLNRRFCEVEKEVLLYKPATSNSTDENVISHISATASPKKPTSSSILSIQDHIWDLQEDIDEANETIKKLEHDVKDIQITCTEAAEKSKYFEEQVKQWQEKYDEKCEECDRIATENQGYICSVNSMRREIDELQQQLLPEAATQASSIYAELDVIRKDAENQALGYLYQVNDLKKQLAARDAKLAKGNWAFGVEKLQNELEWQRNYNETLCKINLEMERDMKEAQNQCQKLKEYLIKKFEAEAECKVSVKLYEISEKEIVTLKECIDVLRKNLREKVLELAGSIKTKETITALEHKVFELSNDKARKRAKDPENDAYKTSEIFKPSVLPSVKMAQQNAVEEPKPVRKEPFFFRPTK